MTPIPEAPTPAAIERAAALLRAGQLVAFPTETVYGLGANALDPEAVAKIFAAKGRPDYNPLIVHTADRGRARALVTAWPEAADLLAARYWPGPLTLVLPKHPSIPAIVTAGLSNVAVRVPAHPVALALLAAADLPLAAPSANPSGAVSPTSADHVARGLGDRVAMILDGGPTDVGIESTVVDLSGAEPVLLRPGMISREALEALVGPVRLAAERRGPEPRQSPGMLDRHYAPRAPLVLFDDANDPRIRTILGEHGRESVGALVLDSPPAGAGMTITLPRDPAGYGRGLYDALHRLDQSGVRLILVQRPPAGAGWAAVHDRLARAATTAP